LFKVYNFKKNQSSILLGFYLFVQFLMQIKFNFNNFIFYDASATAWQRATGKRRRRWRL